MPSSVEIHSNGKLIGTINHDGTKFTVNPPDSQLLQNLLQLPIYVRREGKLEDVHATDDPDAFMRGLYRHYKSQAVSASPPREARPIAQSAPQSPPPAS